MQEISEKKIQNWLDQLNNRKTSEEKKSLIIDNPEDQKEVFLYFIQKPATEWSNQFKELVSSTLLTEIILSTDTITDVLKNDIENKSTICQFANNANPEWIELLLKTKNTDFEGHLIPSVIHLCHILKKAESTLQDKIIDNISQTTIERIISDDITLDYICVVLNNKKNLLIKIFENKKQPFTINSINRLKRILITLNEDEQFLFMEFVKDDIKKLVTEIQPNELFNIIKQKNHAYIEESFGTEIIKKNHMVPKNNNPIKNNIVDLNSFKEVFSKINSKNSEKKSEIFCDIKIYKMLLENIKTTGDLTDVLKLLPEQDQGTLLDGFLFTYELKIMPDKPSQQTQPGAIYIKNHKTKIVDLKQSEKRNGNHGTVKIDTFFFMGQSFELCNNLFFNETNIENALKQYVSFFDKMIKKTFLPIISRAGYFVNPHKKLAELLQYERDIVDILQVTNANHHWKILNTVLNLWDTKITDNECTGILARLSTDNLDCGLIKKSSDGFSEQHQTSYQCEYIFEKGKLFYRNIQSNTPQEVSFLFEKSFHDLKKALSLNKSRTASYNDLQIITSYTKHSHDMEMMLCNSIIRHRIPFKPETMGYMLRNFQIIPFEDLKSIFSQMQYKTISIDDIIEIFKAFEKRICFELPENLNQKDQNLIIKEKRKEIIQLLSLDHFSFTNIIELIARIGHTEEIINRYKLNRLNLDIKVSDLFTIKYNLLKPLINHLNITENLQKIIPDLNALTQLFINNNESIQVIHDLNLIENYIPDAKTLSSFIITLPQTIALHVIQNIDKEKLNHFFQSYSDFTFIRTLDKKTQQSILDNLTPECIKRCLPTLQNVCNCIAYLSEDDVINLINVNKLSLGELSFSLDDIKTLESFQKLSDLILTKLNPDTLTNILDNILNGKQTVKTNITQMLVKAIDKNLHRVINSMDRLWALLDLELPEFVLIFSNLTSINELITSKEDFDKLMEYDPSFLPYINKNKLYEFIDTFQQLEIYLKGKKKSDGTQLIKALGSEGIRRIFGEQQPLNIKCTMSTKKYLNDIDELYKNHNATVPPVLEEKPQNHVSETNTISEKFDHDNTISTISQNTQEPVSPVLEDKPQDLVLETSTISKESYENNTMTTISQNIQESVRINKKEVISCERLMHSQLSITFFKEMDVVKVYDQKVLAEKLRNAVEKNNFNSVEKICKNLVIGNINIPDEETGRTALHIAAKYGFSRCYRFLINQGALNHIKDKEGKTARDYLEQSISECLHLVDLIETNNKVKEKFIFKVGNSKQAPVIGGEVFEAFSTDFFFPEKCGLIKIEDHESFDGIEKKYEKKYKHQYIIKDQSLFYWNINLKNPKQQMLVNEKTWEAFKKELNLNKTRDANWSDLMIIAKYTNHLLETKNMQDCVYEALRINKIGYKETYCVMETQKIMPMTFPLYAEQTDKYIHFSVELDYQNIIEYLDMRFKSKMSCPSRTVLAIFLRSNFSEIETRVLKNTIINDKVTFKINNIDNPTEELFYFMFVEITDEHLRKKQQTNYAIGHYQLYACMPTIFNTLECTYMDVNSAMQNQLTQINKKINALAIPKIPIKSIISPSSEVLDEERIALLILEYAGISSDLIQAGSKNKGYHIPSDLKNTGWNYNGNSFMKTGFYLIEKQISKDAAPLDQNISKKMHETFSKYGNRFSYIIYDEGQTGEIKSHVFYFHETIFTEYLLPYLKDKYSKKSENSNIRSFNSTW